MPCSSATTSGDHISQTDHQAAHKAKATHGDDCADDCRIDHPIASWHAMAGHVGGYTATCAVALAVLRPIGVRPSLRRVLAGLAFSAATHAVIDRRWPVRMVLEATGSPNFAELQAPISGPYLADQSLHKACLFIAALIVAR